MIQHFLLLLLLLLSRIRLSLISILVVFKVGCEWGEWEWCLRGVESHEIPENLLHPPVLPISKGSSNFNGDGVVAGGEMLGAGGWGDSSLVQPSPECWRSTMAVFYFHVKPPQSQFQGSESSSSASALTLEGTKAFCANLNENHQKVLALMISKCHLDDLGKIMIHDPEMRYLCLSAETSASSTFSSSFSSSNLLWLVANPAMLRTCLQQLTDVGVQAYTHYVSYVQNFCTRLTTELLYQHQVETHRALVHQYEHLSRLALEQLDAWADATTVPAVRSTSRSNRNQSINNSNNSSTSSIQQVHPWLQYLHELTRQWQSDWSAELQSTLLTGLIESMATQHEQLFQHLASQWLQFAQKHQQYMHEHDTVLVDRIDHRAKQVLENQEQKHAYWQKQQGMLWQRQLEWSLRKQHKQQITWHEHYSAEMQQLVANQVSDALRKNNHDDNNSRSTMMILMTTMTMLVQILQQPWKYLYRIIVTLRTGYSLLSLIPHFLISGYIIWLVTYPQRCRFLRLILVMMGVCELIIELAWIYLLWRTDKGWWWWIGSRDDADDDGPSLGLLLEFRQWAWALQCCIYFVGMIGSILPGLFAVVNPTFSYFRRGQNHPVPLNPTISHTGIHQHPSQLHDMQYTPKNYRLQGLGDVYDEDTAAPLLLHQQRELNALRQETLHLRRKLLKEKETKSLSINFPLNRRNPSFATHSLQNQNRSMMNRINNTLPPPPLLAPSTSTNLNIDEHSHATTVSPTAPAPPIKSLPSISIDPNTANYHDLSTHYIQLLSPSFVQLGSAPIDSNHDDEEVSSEDKNYHDHDVPSFGATWSFHPTKLTPDDVAAAAEEAATTRHHNPDHYHFHCRHSLKRRRDHNEDDNGTDSRSSLDEDFASNNGKKARV